MVEGQLKRNEAQSRRAIRAERCSLRTRHLSPQAELKSTRTYARCPFFCFLQQQHPVSTECQQSAQDRKESVWGQVVKGMEVQESETLSDCMKLTLS